MGIISIYNNGTVIWIKNVERFLGLKYCASVNYLDSQSVWNERQYLSLSRNS